MLARTVARWRRPVLMGLSVAGAINLVWLFGIFRIEHGGVGYDAFAYWDVRLDDLYGRSMGDLGTFGAFRYSPPIALLFAPFHVLPFELFLTLWITLQAVVLIALAGRYSLAACAYLGVPVALYEGNVDILMAAAIVVGTRISAAWAFPLLAKVTTGVALLVSPRSLLVGALVAGLIAIPTIVVRPDLWRDWFAMLADNARIEQAFPLVLRLPVAFAAAYAAARTSRPWLFGLGIALAQPTFSLGSVAQGLLVSIGLLVHRLEPRLAHAGRRQS